jgi:hypothetical protein
MLEAQDVADFLADTGFLPGPEVCGKYSWIGLVMNTERIVERQRARRLAEVTLTSSKYQVPYNVFRSITDTEDHASELMDSYNKSYAPIRPNTE